jgi:hypothetical protein
MFKFSIDPMIPLKKKEEVLNSLFSENCQRNNFPLINEFYKDKEIFITGGR